MRSRLTIGDFSTITHLSVKTLRRYHETGLLAPDAVDPQSGYRYYTTAQVPTAQVIRRFRDLDMPVRAIADVLATPDPGRRSALIAEHLHRLEDRLATTREAVGALRRLLDPVASALEVVHRREPARVVAAIEGEVDAAGVLDWYSAAMTEIDGALGGAARTGPPGGHYDNALFTHDRGRAVVFVPTDAPPTAGRVHPRTLPERELALTVHHGPHHDIDVTYAALGAHLADHALTLDGPVHETYRVGPRDTDDPTAWRTEIGWPVFRTARGS